MIISTNAKGFRGLEFDQKLGSKTLFVGPNGVGKSARSDAIILLLTGSLPGKGRPEAILETYGSENKLTVGAKIGKKTLHRQLCRDKKGSVSQKFLVNRLKAKKEDFIKAMAEAGAPKVVDLGAFVSLSSQKMIDYIFELFPPSEDLGKLDDEIKELQEKINAKYADIRDGEKLIASLMDTKAEMQLPQGTLAEIRAEIEKTLTKHGEVSDQIKAAEVAEATEKERLATIARAEKKLKVPEEMRIGGTVASETELSHINRSGDTAKQKGPSGYKAWFDSENQPKPGEQTESKNGNPIQKIIEAMDKVGCGLCAARIVAKRELKSNQPISF